MAKSIPAKEFKAAVKSLNEVLAEAEEEKIKIVGVKKEVVVEKFTNSVLNFIDEDRADELPDNVIDFYNDHIASEDEDEEPEEKPAPKKKPAGKKAPAKKKPAEKKEKKPGIVLLSVKAYMEDGCTTAKEIVEHIQDQFPERNIAKTVSHCFGVLKHIKPYK